MIASSNKNVLILGAGYVSETVVEYLSRDKTISLTLVSALKNEADRLASKYPNTYPMLLDVTRSHEELEKLIKNHNMVISLLPYSFHPSIAQSCIRHKVNMVTASYLSKEMKDLHDKAVQAGITIMNEVGVDPGIDHMLAMQVFDEVKEAGGTIKSYYSYCGGLPAPECGNNSLRYKFSWSPKAVLLNTISSAKYLKNGKVIELPPGGALLEQGSTTGHNFLPAFNLESIPNRDSINYIDQYNIHSVHSIFRGTLRYKGFSNNVMGLIKIGLISSKDHSSLHINGPDITWRQFMCDIMGQNHDLYYENLKSIIFTKLDENKDQLDTIEELGLLSDDLVPKLGNPIDSLCAYLAKRLVYGPNERDIIIMHHEIGISWPNGKNEIRNVDFIHYGTVNGLSAMAQTVGYTTAIAAKMVLEKEIQTTGMVLPLSKNTYGPILNRLKAENISWTETSKTVV